MNAILEAIAQTSSIYEVPLPIAQACLAHYFLGCSRAEATEAVLQDHDANPYFDSVESLQQISSLLRNILPFGSSCSSSEGSFLD